MVNFLVTLNIGNTLSSPSVAFDLSTDDDVSISNELQSMTPDQRQQQAINLLLTGTYTGPGAKTVNSNLVTGNLYNFLSSRLNALAARSIKGVDINFGVDQYQTGVNGNTTTNMSYSYQVSKSLINNRFKILVGGNYSTDASADENFQQNLLSDIAFEYILKQTNNMSLNARLFRHTGFESVLEGEITETASVSHCAADSHISPKSRISDSANYGKNRKRPQCLILLAHRHSPPRSRKTRFSPL